MIRDGELLFMSPQQQHEFNFPYQIGSPDSMSDTPAVAQRFSVEVRPHAHGWCVAWLGGSLGPALVQGLHVSRLCGAAQGPACLECR